MLGRAEIAELLGVNPQTVTVWQFRNIFPDPDQTNKAGRLYRRSTIEKWAKETGRWPE